MIGKNAKIQIFVSPELNQLKAIALCGMVAFQTTLLPMKHDVAFCSLRPRVKTKATGTLRAVQWFISKSTTTNKKAPGETPEAI
ncbi:hypothetical protein C0081_07920 [Cohaesibacter celericrescens]|uniref:Uncharacterized protein n=1 Tax=Cohaesibacter celericrescens TaxID=2067669 RepID=A0A2N5XTF4_9HYPH|nr:hypothetical protein C0081_07920 [Cohaesibacter celericrescens]